MTGALSAVQARITELQALVDPTSATSTSTSASTSASSSTSFASALAALGLSSTGTTETSIAPGSGVTGTDLVEAATQYLGVPYVWGGESLDEGGLDCSGLVQLALADLGITDVPRTAREQATLGTEVSSLDDAQPGDLLVFGGGTHIGIYVGDGQMIDAPSAGKTVTIRDVYTEPTTIRRILPSESSSASLTSSALSSLVSSASGQSALALLTGSSSSTDLSSVLSALTSGSTTGSTSSLSSLSALAALTGSSSTSSSALSSSSLLSSLWGSVS